MTSLTAILVMIAMTHKPLVPAGGAKPVGPYVPGLAIGDYVYASGQGASDASGHRATDIESQTRQAIFNVRVILEAGGRYEIRRMGPSRPRRCPRLVQYADLWTTD